MGRVGILLGVIALLGLAYLEAASAFGSPTAAAVMACVLALIGMSAALERSAGRARRNRWNQRADRIRSRTVLAVGLLGAPGIAALSAWALASGTGWTWEWIGTGTAAVVLGVASWTTVVRSRPRPRRIRRR